MSLIYNGEVGINAKVTLANKEVIEGWIYAETIQGIYLSLDKNGDNIRFIQGGDYQGIQYSDHDVSEVIQSNRVDEKTLNTLLDKIVESLEDTINKLDQNKMNSLGRKFIKYKYKLQTYQEHDFTPQESLHIVNKLVELYFELEEELQKSALDKFLFEYSEEIRKIITPYTLPLLDEYTLLHDIVEQVETAQEYNYVTETDLGRVYIYSIQPERVMEFDQELEQTQDYNREPEKSKKSRRLKKIAAGIKIANGGGLAAANLVIGGLTGIVTALPTLGIGSVAASIGIATSVYTGINKSCEGIKDLASITTNQEG